MSIENRKVKTIYCTECGDLVTSRILIDERKAVCRRCVVTMSRVFDLMKIIAKALKLKKHREKGGLSGNKSKDKKSSGASTGRRRAVKE